MAEVKEFTGEVAIVTGASGGLGFAVSKMLLEKGCKVAAFGRSLERLKEAFAQTEFANKDSLLCINGNVSSEEDVIALFAKVKESLGVPGKIVNNAANSILCRVENMELSQWNDIMDVQAKGTFLMCREAVRLWKTENKTGSIVNVASVSAKMGAPMISAYVAAKAAIIAFSKSLAMETAGKNIRVNTVCPGAMDTPMFHKGTLEPLVELYKRDKETLLKGTLQMIPMHRLIDPKEVSETICFLLSDKASCITGQSYNADCGYCMY